MLVNFKIISVHPHVQYIIAIANNAQGCVIYGYQNVLVKPAMWNMFIQNKSLSTQIIHTDSNTVLGQNDTGFSCDGTANTFRVMFKEPVEILPSVNYIACATLKVVYWAQCL